MTIKPPKKVFLCRVCSTPEGIKKSIRSILTLLAGAFLLAALAGAQPVYIRKLAEEVLRNVSSAERSKVAKLLSSGDLAKASSELRQIALRDARAPTSARLRQFAEMLKEEDPARWRELVQVDGPTIPLGQATQLSPTDLSQFRVVEGGSRRLLSFTIVPLRVKQFIDRYSLGYRNPEAVFALADSRMLHQIQRAKSVPRERVVTMISAGKDRELVLRRTADFESAGYVVLSYLFCETPAGKFCGDEMIGAFARISGFIVELNTANARNSRMVFEEVDAVTRLRSNQELVTVVSYGDLAAAVTPSIDSLGTLVTVSARCYLAESKKN